MKRQRGRGRRSSGGNNNNPNKHFESNGPDVKIRGSAQQILEKYQQYARDAQSSGDRVNAENYLQHAEHYYRLLAAMKPIDKPKHEPREGEASEGETVSGAPISENKKHGEEADSHEPREHNRDRGRSRDRQERDEDSSETGNLTDTKAFSAEKDNDRQAKPANPSEMASLSSEDKPKRRRSYKKRETDATVTEEGDDGIMKTLSRGRKKTDIIAAETETVAIAGASATDT